MIFVEGTYSMLRWMLSVFMTFKYTIFGNTVLIGGVVFFSRLSTFVYFF